VIHEYVAPDRFQFPPHQPTAVSNAIKNIPASLRKRLKRATIKNVFYGSGRSHVIVADRSECVDSSSVLPACRSVFMPMYERGFGGDITMNALKDITHHSAKSADTATKVLPELFIVEDTCLKDYESDFIFGLYKKP
jgi:hypothetical protein